VLIFAYATYFPIRWLSPADSQMSVYLICNWVFPVFAALSVLLHKALRDNKWKLLTVVLELRPKKDGLVREDGDEDTQALLNYDELTRKDDR
jgi:hypothetical protein